MKVSVHRLSGTAFSSNTLIVVAAEATLAGLVARLPGALKPRLTHVVKQRKTALEAGAILSLPGQGPGQIDVVLAVLPKAPKAHRLLEFARDTLKKAVQPTTSGVDLVFAKDAATRDVLDTLGAAVGARTFAMPVIGKRAAKAKAFALSRVGLHVDVPSGLSSLQEAFESGRKVVGGTNLARSLAMLPSNVLDPRGYGTRIEKLAREHGFKTRFYSAAELKRMGAGAFTAVDQANPRSAGGIWKVQYLPRKGSQRKRPRIALVGKGLCFDTGGYDIKVGGGMVTMKGDMQGSAVALGTLVAAHALELDVELTAYLAVTENHVSPTGFKADDVVTALNGLSIEIVNTDAEGRMVLSDALTLASREKPDLVLDFATLTGSAVRAIGTKYSAGFTNREELHEPIRVSGERSGERIWTFPTDETFTDQLESKIADTKQCLKGGTADHILAACFLQKFVEPGVPWVHIDLSASENDGGIGPVDSLFTGFGVRWAVDFIQTAPVG